MLYIKQPGVNILFIHIPKTGGTSVTQYLFRKYKMKFDMDLLCRRLHNPVGGSLQHMKYTTILRNIDLLGLDFNNLQIITIIRNPYDRVISDLFFLKLIDTSSTPEKTFKVIQNYIINSQDNHHHPQNLYITMENKKIIPNLTIMRTETLNEDMHNLGYTDFSLRARENKNKVNYKDYLNEDSIKLINEYYKDDFLILGFEKISI
jgi:hypothetical protein